ncbi:hypothetical protein [Citrobacter werkmanii]|uniref:hypothetical protein n=1 Tax=Citrobacter werkmanii TaxID=67827 RepID=UPI002F2F51A0
MRISCGEVMYIVGESGIGVPRSVKVNNLALVNRPVFPLHSEEVIEVVKATRAIQT